LIGRLTGRLLEDEGGAVVVDVAGVGYEVTVPLGTLGRVERGSAPDVGTLFVHTHVREDAFSLFGFASSAEREVFRTLIGISNVGPKLALSVLSAITIDDLAAAVNRQEIAKLVAIPGVGKKTAERLVLELKGKLQLAPQRPQSQPGPVALAPATPAAELLTGTLVRMGFRQNEAERAVATLAQSRDLGGAPIAELVREALALLSR
jgi:Holliday junction DNA helicase RuvA